MLNAKRTLIKILWIETRKCKGWTSGMVLLCLILVHILQWNICTLMIFNTQSFCSISHCSVLTCWRCLLSGGDAARLFRRPRFGLVPVIMYDVCKCEQLLPVPCCCCCLSYVWLLCVVSMSCICAFTMYLLSGCLLLIANCYVDFFIHLMVQCCFQNIQFNIDAFDLTCLHFLSFSVINCKIHMCVWNCIIFILFVCGLAWYLLLVRAIKV